MKTLTTLFFLLTLFAPCLAINPKLPKIANGSLPYGRSEASKCDELRTDINATEADIRGLQDDLKTAPPPLKAGIAKQIVAQKKKLQKLKAQAKKLGCKL